MGGRLGIPVLLAMPLAVVDSQQMQVMVRPMKLTSENGRIDSAGKIGQLPLRGIPQHLSKSL
jgi:hypothetical protein